VQSPDIQHYGLHPDTLGIEAVRDVNASTVNVINYGLEVFDFNSAYKKAEQVKATKQIAHRPGGLRTDLGRLAGFVMTPQDEALIRYVGFEQRLDGHLEEVCARLLGLSAAQNKLLNQFCDSSTPAFLSDQIPNKGNMEEGIDWSGWLSDPDNKPQLINFLQWHAHRLERQQLNPAVKAEIALQREEYKRDVERGIKEGWLSEDAKRAVDELKYVKVYIGDIFSTLLEQYDGYHLTGTYKVAVASSNDLTDQVAKIKNAAKHEFNHAVLGTLGERWMDEALTEHISRVFENGQPEIIRPYDRQDGGFVYAEERKLLAEVLEGGSIRIPADMATRAYSAADPESEDYSRFFEELEKSWSHKTRGRPFLKTLNSYIAALEENNHQAGMTLIEARKEACLSARMYLQYMPNLIFDADQQPLTEAA
jgi:hypothetical protein